MWRWLFTFAAIVSHALLIFVLFIWLRSYWAWDEVTYYAPFATGETAAEFSFLSEHGSFGLEYNRVTLSNGESRSDGLTIVSAQEHDETGTSAFPGFAFQWHLADHTDDPNATRITFAGFAWLDFTYKRPGGITGWARVAIMPYWFLATVLSILPVVWFIITRRRLRALKRQAAGLCTKCGYDPGSAATKCPECGIALVTMRIPQSPV